MIYTPTKDKEANDYLVASLLKAAKYFAESTPLPVQRQLRMEVQPVIDGMLRVMVDSMTPDKRFRVHPTGQTIFPRKPKRAKQAFNPALASLGTSVALLKENVLVPCLADPTLRKPCWHELLCMEASGEINHLVNRAVADMDQDQKKTFEEAVEEARTIWSCKSCKTLPPDKLADDFLKCSACGNTYHSSCVGVDNGEVPPLWTCPYCL